MNLSVLIVPALLCVGSAFGWYHLRSGALLIATFGFLVVAISSGLSLWVLPHLSVTDTVMPNQQDWRRAEAVAVISAAGSVVGSLGILMFGLRAKAYAKSNT